MNHSKLNETNINATFNDDVDVSPSTPNATAEQLWHFFKNYINLDKEEKKNLLQHPNFPVDRLIEEYPKLDLYTRRSIAELVDNQKVIEEVMKDKDWEVERNLLSNQNLSKENLYKYFKTLKYNSYSLNLDEILKHKNSLNVYKEHILINLPKILTLSSCKILTLSSWMLEYVDNPVHVILHNKYTDGLANSSKTIPEEFKVLVDAVLFRVRTKNLIGRSQNTNVSTLASCINIDDFETGLLDQIFQKTIDKRSIQKLINEHFYPELEVTINSDFNDPSVLQQILQFDDSLINTYILFNENLSANVLEAFADHDNAFMRLLVANHRSTPSHVLNKLINDSEEIVSYEALNNSNFNNAAVIQSMVSSNKVAVRREAAKLLNLSFDQMIELVSDKDLEVQAGLYFNKNVPKSLINLQ